MAAPPEITLKNLSGIWVMNKTLSDDTDKILALQGVNWFLRKIIALATITLHISQYEEDSITHINIDQFATGGIKTTEERTLNWQVKRHEDSVFGVVFGQSRWVKLADVDDDEFLKNGWDDLIGEHVQSYVESHDNGWTANQIWGFEVVQGTRYHVRHVVVRKGDDWKQARLVYNFQSK